MHGNEWAEEIKIPNSINREEDPDRLEFCGSRLMSLAVKVTNSINSGRPGSQLINEYCYKWRV